MAKQLFLLTHEFFPKRGGIAVYTEEMARAAAGLGWATTVWAPGHQALLKKKFPFSLYPLPIRGDLGWRDRKTLMVHLMRHRRLFAEARVLLTEPGPILAAMYLRALRALPFQHFALALHGSEILRFHRCPHRRVLFRALLCDATKIGVISRFTQKLLLRYYPFLKEKTIVVSGSLRGDFKPAVKASLNKNSPNQTEGVGCVILSLGRVHPRKGFHYLIEALQCLPERLKARVLLRIAGPDSDASYLKRLKYLADKSACLVEFVGSVTDEELPALFAAADIFVLSSVRVGPSVEGFGLVCLEAGASGLPVIASRSGGIPDAVRDGETGLLVNPKNKRVFAKAIERLVESKGLRQKLGQAAQARVQELSWSRNVERLIGNP